MNAVQTYRTTRDDQECDQPGRTLKPTRDLVAYFREYAREKPTVVALWCLGIGVVLGWKLKPW